MAKETSTDQVLSGGYRVVRRLPGSGVGEMVVARAPGDGEEVAIKLLRLTEDWQLAGFDRMVLCAERAALLGHPGIGSLLAVDQRDFRRPFLVTERLVGQDLAALIEARGPLPLAELQVLLGRLADLLGAAHDEGILHGTLKPGNLFFVQGEAAQVQVLDFGIHHLERTPLANGRFLVGRPPFVAPEQAAGQQDPDERTDLFLVGAVLYHALSGHVPYEARDLPRFMESLCHDDPPRLWAPSDRAAKVSALLHQAMARDPAARPGNLRAFLVELGQALDRLPEAERPRSPAQAVRAWPIGARLPARGPGARSDGPETNRRAGPPIGHGWPEVQFSEIACIAKKAYINRKTAIKDIDSPLAEPPWMNSEPGAMAHRRTKRLPAVVEEEGDLSGSASPWPGAPLPSPERAENAGPAGGLFIPRRTQLLPSEDEGETKPLSPEAVRPSFAEASMTQIVGVDELALENGAPSFEDNRTQENAVPPGPGPRGFQEQGPTTVMHRPWPATDEAAGVEEELATTDLTVDLKGLDLGPLVEEETGADRPFQDEGPEGPGPGPVGEPEGDVRRRALSGDAEASDTVVISRPPLNPIKT